jgi:hypothetical protein
VGCLSHAAPPAYNHQLYETLLGALAIKGCIDLYLSKQYNVYKILYSLLSAGRVVASTRIYAFMNKGLKFLK